MSQSQSNSLKRVCLSSNQKPVLQATLQLRKNEVEALKDWSLGKAVEAAFASYNYEQISKNAYAIGVWCDLVGYSDNPYLLGLIMSHLPSEVVDETRRKVRDIKFETPDIVTRQVNDVSQKLEGLWKITSANGKVKTRKFKHSDKNVQDFAFGTTLYYLVEPGVKTMPQNHSLELKPRGELIHDGDYLEFECYKFKLDTQDRGSCVMVTITLNFTHMFTHCSDETQCVVEQVNQREQSQDVSQEMSEDDVQEEFEEVEDYDDLEYC
jgi:hypothetical protein